MTKSSTNGSTHMEKQLNKKLSSRDQKKIWFHTNMLLASIRVFEEELQVFKDCQQDDNEIKKFEHLIKVFKILLNKYND